MDESESTANSILQILLCPGTEKACILIYILNQISQHQIHNVFLGKYTITNAIQETINSDNFIMKIALLFYATIWKESCCTEGTDYKGNLHKAAKACETGLPVLPWSVLPKIWEDWEDKKKQKTDMTVNIP